jgi:hypothetical protein
VFSEARVLANEVCPVILCGRFGVVCSNLMRFAL